MSGPKPSTIFSTNLKNKGHCFSDLDLATSKIQTTQEGCPTPRPHHFSPDGPCKPGPTFYHPNQPDQPSEPITAQQICFITNPKRFIEIWLVGGSSEPQDKEEQKPEFGFPF